MKELVSHVTTARRMIKSRALFYFVSALLLVAASASVSVSQESERRLRVAVLDFGPTDVGKQAPDKLAQALAGEKWLQVMDRDEARAASSGMGYNGSLNMTLEEARDLGASTGADFFITGDAQTLRRSPFDGPPYYEAYASIFIVSSRTGRLIKWERPSFKAPTPEEASAAMLRELSQPGMASSYRVAILRAFDDERQMRMLAVGQRLPVIEEAPDDTESPAAKGLRLPLPYRRLRPSYPETAALAEAEATVDVEVDVTAEGEVSRVEVVRWAGFGLDEATAMTVRRMHFRPAMRDGYPIPMRVLLRYNFRKPPVDGKR
jgi:TonB family protein